MSLHKLLAAGVVTLLFAGSAFAQNAICYNCPPEWADWGTQLKAIKEKTGVTVPADNKNSGQSLAQLVAEKSRASSRCHLPRGDLRDSSEKGWCRYRL